MHFDWAQRKGAYLRVGDLPVGVVCKALKRLRPHLGLILRQHENGIPQYYLQFDYATNLDEILEYGVIIDGNTYPVFENPIASTPGTIYTQDSCLVKPFKGIRTEYSNLEKECELEKKVKVDGETGVAEPVLLPNLPFTVQNKIIEYCFGLPQNNHDAGGRRAFGGGLVHEDGTVGILGWYGDCCKLDLNLVCWRFFNVVSQIVTRVCNVRNPAIHQPLNFFTHMTSRFCVLKRVTHLVTTNRFFAFTEHNLGKDNDRALADKVYEEGVLASLEYLMMEYGPECTHRNPYEIECILFKTRNIQHFVENDLRHPGYGCGILMLLTSTTILKTLILATAPTNHLLSYIPRVIRNNLATLEYARIPMTVRYDKHKDVLELDDLLSKTDFTKVESRYDYMNQSESESKSESETKLDIQVSYKRTFDGDVVESNEALAELIQEDSSYQSNASLIITYKRESTDKATVSLHWFSTFYKSLLSDTCTTNIEDIQTVN